MQAPPVPRRNPRRLENVPEDPFDDLQGRYIEEWRNFRPLTTTSYRLNSPHDPNDPYYDRDINDSERRFRTGFERCEALLLELLKLNQSYALYEDIVEHHQMLAVDTSMIVATDRMRDFRGNAEQLIRSGPSEDIIDELRKKYIVIDVLINRSSSYVCELIMSQTNKRVLKERYDTIVACILQCHKKLLVLMTRSTKDMNYLRRGLLKRHINMVDSFYLYKEWYAETSGNECDTSRLEQFYTKVPEDPTSGLELLFMDEFIETARVMYKMYETAQKTNYNILEFKGRCYCHYVRAIKELDKILKDAARRPDISTERTMWMREFRDLLPNPIFSTQKSGKGIGAKIWRHLVVWPTSTDVRDFCKMVEYWIN